MRSVHVLEVIKINEGSIENVLNCVDSLIGLKISWFIENSYYLFCF